jgi:hypothetical protein
MFHISPPPNPKQTGSSFIPAFKAIPQSYSSSFKIARQFNYLEDKRPSFPADSKEDRMRVEDNILCFQVCLILRFLAYWNENIPISNIKITDIS